MSIMARAGRIASSATQQALKQVKTEKRCTKCLVVKPLEDFPKAGFTAADNVLQYRAYCRDCFNAGQREALLLKKQGKQCDTCEKHKAPDAFVDGSATCQKCESKIAAGQKRPELHWVFTKAWSAQA